MDCGDNSCVFAESKGGMRTNGGCRCLENTLLTREQARDVMWRVLSLAQGKRQAEKELAAKDAEIARLKRIEVAARELVSWDWLRLLDESDGNTVDVINDVRKLEKALAANGGDNANGQ